MQLYGSRPLLEKLGVKEGMRVCVLGSFQRSFERHLEQRSAAKPAKALRGDYDLIFLALAAASELKRLPVVRAHLKPAGAIWLVYVKGKGAPVGETRAREAILACDLVDTKVVAFSETHSALRAVIPLALRSNA